MMNQEQLKLLPLEVKESPKGTVFNNTFIKDGGALPLLEMLPAITARITELQVQNSAVKTGGVFNTNSITWPIQRAYLNATDPTGLAVPAIEAGEEVVNKIITFLPKLLAKAISGNEFDVQEVTNISNTLQQIQDKSISPEDGFNRLKEMQRKLGYNRGPQPPADLVTA